MAVVSNVEIRVNAKNAIQQLDLIQKKTGNLPGTFGKSAAASTKLGGGMKAAGAAATGLGVALKSALAPLLAIGVAVGAVTKSFSIMGQRQADVAALENGLSNLGITGDKVLTALQAKADAFGKVTLFSEEDYTKAATQLTSFTNISVSEFDRVINVAGDVAQVMNQDVNSAVTQLAKALNAPTQNLSALSRSGIQFTEQQKEQIKALEASGQLQAAQGLILAELERQYQGAALAAGSAGLAGALDGLSEVANDAFEVFGKILEPIAVPVIQGITNAIQFMSDTWAYISEVIFPQIIAAAKPLTDALMRVFSAVDVEKFGTILQNIFIRGLENLTVVIGGVSRVLGFVIDRFVELSNTPVFKFIADQVGRLAGMLGLTTDRVGEFNDAQKMSQTEADKILATQTQITNAADNTNESQKEINATLKGQTSELQRQNYLQSQMQSRSSTITSKYKRSWDGTYALNMDHSNRSRTLFSSQQIMDPPSQQSQYVGHPARNFDTRNFGTRNFGTGGYVSSPTNALVGEGGSEYVIPSSKMAAAMERYAAGKRGNEVVPNGNDTQVNVSTGPVMQMNGQNYVTQSDFEKGLRSTVNQVMTTLRRSPNTRAAVGI